MASFMDYYQDELRKKGGARPAAQQGVSLSSLKAPESNPIEEILSPSSPIGWGLDMLSRPLYTVQNNIRARIDGASEAASKISGVKREGKNITVSDPDPIGGLLQGVGTALGLTPETLGAGFKGLLSNEKSAKISTSNNIEHAVDTVNQYNQQYEDTDDNVNPVAKGVLGFVGDVGLDPLTYIPGAAFATVGRGIAKAVKGSAGAVKGAVAGAKEATAAAKGAKEVSVLDEAEELVPAMSTAEREAADVAESFATTPATPAAPASAVPSATSLADDVPVAPTAVTPAAVPVPKLDVPAAPVAPTAQAAQKLVEGLSQGESLAQVIKTSPKIPGIKAEIENLNKIFTAPAAKAAPVAAKPFVFDEWLNSDAMTKTRLPGDESVRDYTYAELDGIARQLTPNTPRGKAAFEAVRTGMKEAQKAPVVPVDAIMQGVDAAQKHLADGGAVLRNVFGDDLVDYLASKGTKTSFSRALSKLGTIFGRDGADLDRILSRDPRLRDALLPTFKAELDAVKMAPNTPESVETALAQLKELSPVAKIVGSIFRKQNLPRTPEFENFYKQLAGKVAKGEDGTANLWKQTNTFTQYSILSKLWSEIDLRIQGVAGRGLSGTAQLQGPVRAAAVREGIEKLGRDLTDAMETFGTPLHIGYGASDDLVRLTFPDVYAGVGKAMDELVGDATLTNLALYNQGTAIAPSRLLNAVQQAIINPGMGRDEIEAFIRKTTLDSDGPNAGKALSNNIVKEGGQGYFFLPSARKAADALAARVGGTVVKKPKGFQVITPANNSLATVLADAIVASRAGLTELAAKNADEWAARGISEAKELAGQQLRSLRMLATNETKAGQRQFAAAVKRKNDELAKQAANIAATPEGTAAAVLATDAAIGDDVLREATIVTSQERHLTEGKSFEEAGTTAAESRYRAAEEGDPADMLKDVTPEADIAPGVTAKEVVDNYDLGVWADAKRQAVMAGTWGERLNKLFNRNFGLTGTNVDRLLKTGNASGRFVADAVTKPLSRLARTVDRPTIANALRAVQQGTKVDPATPLGQTAQELETIIGKLFDTEATPAGGSAMGNIFLESGAGLEQINATLRWAFGQGTDVQLSRELAVETAKTALREGGGKYTKTQLKARTESELRDQWRTWNFGDDATDAVARLGQAAGRVVEHKTTVTSFVMDGVKHGWVSKEPKEGFVKVVSSGDSSFRGLLPKNIYVSKEIAPELARLDYLTTVSRQLSGEVGDFVRGTLIPMTNVWKQGMTIYRPGHHVRNMLGNLTLQYVARGTRSIHESHKAAWKLMAMRNDFEGLDALAGLKALGDDVVPRSGDTLFTTDKFGDFTTDEVWTLVNREGLLPTYAASEGLLTGEVREAAAVSRLLKPLDAANNPVGRLGGATSQNLDHLQRVHHFTQILMQEGSKRGGKWKGLTREQMIVKAAEETRRLHPDSSMLTAAENKYMKVAIPFYTWMRGVLPGAFESAMQHPGRVTMFSKASYNLAISMGLNPDSLSDPFPTDQLFPSFIQEAALGPQFQVGDKYIRINPGVAQFDLAQSFGADPVRGVAGMVNPFLRVPMELLSGGSWSTGGRINDAGEYAEQSIPGVNYLANLTGISPIGSVESILSGQGLDQQGAVAKGNKDDFDTLLTGINWLTGLGAQNLSRPNYINYAEIEKRNAASKEK